MSEYDIGELSRMLANLVRIGKVVQLDEVNARVKVGTAGLTTDWLPWAAARAGQTRQWSPPQVGEQVVIVSPYGDMGQAIVMGSLYQDDKPAPASSKDQETVIFPDGSAVDYNSESNTLTVTVSGAGNVVVNCKHATVNAETDVTVTTATASIAASAGVQVTTPLANYSGNVTVAGIVTCAALAMTGAGGGSATLTGNLTVNGNVTTTGGLTNNGKNVGSTHTHGGVSTGGGTSGAPT